MLMRDSFGRSLYQAFRLSSLMPTQKDTQSQVARKVNFAIQLLRETADLLETRPNRHSARSALAIRADTMSSRAMSSAHAKPAPTVLVLPLPMTHNGAQGQGKWSNLPA